MSVEEVFKKIIEHMAEGVRYHEEFMKAYYFLGLYGYAREQREHHDEEFDSYNKIIKYYMTHYFKLLKLDDAPKPSIIPDNWYKYTSQDVDVGTKRNAIKELMTKWVNWEKETKKLYEEMYLELTNLREITAAIRVKKLIEDVSKELKKAAQELLYLETIGYDLTLIIDWQKE